MRSALERYDELKRARQRAEKDLVSAVSEVLWEVFDRHPLIRGFSWDLPMTSREFTITAEWESDNLDDTTAMGDGVFAYHHCFFPGDEDGEFRHGPLPTAYRDIAALLAKMSRDLRLLGDGKIVVTRDKVELVV